MALTHFHHTNHVILTNERLTFGQGNTLRVESLQILNLSSSNNSEPENPTRSYENDGDEGKKKSWSVLIGDDVVMTVL